MANELKARATFINETQHDAQCSYIPPFYSELKEIHPPFAQSCYTNYYSIYNVKSSKVKANALSKVIEEKRWRAGRLAVETLELKNDLGEFCLSTLNNNAVI